MRRIFDPTSGTDVTSTVQAALQANRTLYTAYLYRFVIMDCWTYNPSGTYTNFCYTSGDFPIAVSYYQIDASATAKEIGKYSGESIATPGCTFLPERIAHDKLAYKIGFEDNPVELSWWMDDTQSYAGDDGVPLSGATSPANLTLKQALWLGAFKECPLWIHSALFTDAPSKGGTFLGTALMFRGYIRKVDTTRSTLKLGLASLMDVFNQVKVPTQTITPQNRAMAVLPIAVAPSGGAAVDSISVNNPTSITLHSNFGTFSWTENQLRDCWMSFVPFIDGASYPTGWLPPYGLPPPPVFRISGNTAGGSGAITLYFYKPPIVPGGGGIPLPTVFGQNPNSGTGAGFLYVPPPEYSV